MFLLVWLNVRGCFVFLWNFAIFIHNGNWMGTTVARIGTACRVYLDALWHDNPRQPMQQPPSTYTHGHFTKQQRNKAHLKLKTDEHEKHDTASCHFSSCLIGANKLLFSHSVPFPFFFSLFGVWRGGWAHLYTGPGLNRLLSRSFFLVLTVSVAGCPWWRPSRPQTQSV